MDEIVDILSVMFGCNEKQINLWLHSDNYHLGNKPRELIITPEGYKKVINYLHTISKRP